MSNFQPSPEQQAILDFVQQSRQNLAIEALAGTGKTTLTEIDAVIRVLTIYKQIMLKEAALEAV